METIDLKSEWNRNCLHHNGRPCSCMTTWRLFKEMPTQKPQVRVYSWCRIPVHHLKCIVQRKQPVRNSEQRGQSAAYSTTEPTTPVVSAAVVRHHHEPRICDPTAAPKAAPGTLEINAYVRTDRDNVEAAWFSHRSSQLFSNLPLLLHTTGAVS
ncbi:hypothetical protein BaRGS_00007302 [Batillaria attramentaria]|uniref:Uncharacterized protein n=1 Tax=Batillaria attramentaria TaxID=370345 RepID=A0ABD0LR48_9CAEN